LSGAALALPSARQNRAANRAANGSLCMIALQ
jgi:hypothetical protein